MSITNELESVLSEITDAKERDFAVKLFKRVGPAIDRQIDARLSDTGQRRVGAHEQRFRNLLGAWRNHGFLPDGSGVRITFADMIKADTDRANLAKQRQLPKGYSQADEAYFWNNPQLLPRVISTIVREPMEPLYVLTNLFQKVRFESPLSSIMMPAVSAYLAGSLDMAESDPYPEGKFEYAGSITATMGRCGIAVRTSEEMVKFSTFDMVAMHLRAAGIALARWKEGKAWDRLNADGEDFRDNSSGSVALHTRGRGADGQYNGSFSLQDLHDAFADAINDGFMPNTMIVHPLFWTVMAADPVMRNWAYAMGPKMIWQGHSGEVASVEGWANRGQSGGLLNNTFVSDPTQLQTTQTPIPAGLFPYPVQVIVSPFVDYNSTDNTTTVILCDRSEIGLLCVNEEPNTREWEDPQRDIRMIRIREKYAFNVMNDGKAIRKFKNVILTRSYDFDDKISWEAGTGALPTTESFDLTS